MPTPRAERESNRDPSQLGDALAPVSELLQAIGRRVRARRLEQHLTLDELSARSGVSRRMITMLEAGETNASIGTLDKLARALGLDFATLAAIQPVPRLTPGTTHAVAPAWGDGRGSTAHLLDSRVGARVVEFWRWELVGGARYEAEPDPPGSEELLLVHAGRLIVEIGSEHYALGAGEHIRLPTDAPYSYVNPDRKAVRFERVAVIT
jgi:transcriptional regulator with XRE-family HTH domain